MTGTSKQVLEGLGGTGRASEGAGRVSGGAESEGLRENKRFQKELGGPQITASDGRG